MRFSWRGMENRRERRKTTRKGGKEGKRKKERTEFFLEIDEEDKQVDKLNEIAPKQLKLKPTKTFPTNILLLKVQNKD